MDISDVELLARLVDSLTSSAILLAALVWQARRTVTLSDRLSEVHERHKTDLRRAAGIKHDDDDDDN